LALGAFSLEGKNYWMIKAAPLRSETLLAAKFAVAYLPALAMSWLFLLGLAVFQGMALPVFLHGLLVVALSVAGCTGIYMAFGIAGAKLDWDDPRHALGGSSGCVSMPVTMFYYLACLIVFYGPIFLARLADWPEAAGTAIGLVLGAGLAGACALLPPWLLRGRIPRLGEA
jgi:hypothetical protein